MTRIAYYVQEFQSSSGLSEHHRYRSWEHCYRYFQTLPGDADEEALDLAALHLGAYLASWGMYRGSGFLLQNAYTAHRPVVDCVRSDEFRVLRKAELGAGSHDPAVIDALVTLSWRIRAAYRPAVGLRPGSRPASDTLVSKVILGTTGAMPAMDRFVREGIRAERLKSGRIGPGLLLRLASFAGPHLDQFRIEQDRIERERGLRYPLMKVVDMYLWQRGYEIDEARRRRRANA